MNEFKIPSLDLNDYKSENLEKKNKFIQNIGKAFSEIGFVSISNYGLSPKEEENLSQVSQNFFALNEQSKRKYEDETTHGQRGYVSKRKEQAKDAKLPDLKEFYHVGNPDFGENIWPKEIQDFEKSVQTAYKKLEKSGIDLLRAIAEYLTLEVNYFDNHVKRGNSILRLIHYYPTENESLAGKGAVRAAAHGDINLITLLIGASSKGLELLNKKNKWVPVTAIENHLIVNVGDMLSRFTNEKLTSTIHRVVNPDETSTSRYSFPFFLHPKPDMDLSIPDNFVSEFYPKKHEDINARDFLLQRLKEIGLKV